MRGTLRNVWTGVVILGLAFWWIRSSRTDDDLGESLQACLSISNRQLNDVQGDLAYCQCTVKALAKHEQQWTRSDDDPGSMELYERGKELGCGKQADALYHKIFSKHFLESCEGPRCDCYGRQLAQLKPEELTALAQKARDREFSWAEVDALTSCKL